MSKKNAKSAENGKRSRRVFTREFREDAVRMLLDGHTARSVCDRLGLSGTGLLYRWKKEVLGKESVVASNLESRVRELESELRRVERERDILKKALSIFGRER